MYITYHIHTYIHTHISASRECVEIAHRRHAQAVQKPNEKRKTDTGRQTYMHTYIYIHTSAHQKEGVQAAHHRHARLRVTKSPTERYMCMYLYVMICMHVPLFRAIMCLSFYRTAHLLSE